MSVFQIAGLFVITIAASTLASSLSLNLAIDATNNMGIFKTAA